MTDSKKYCLMSVKREKRLIRDSACQILNELDHCLNTLHLKDQHYRMLKREKQVLRHLFYQLYESIDCLQEQLEPSQWIEREIESVER